MVTTIYNRVLASSELGKLIDIARADHVREAVLQQMQASHNAYIFNSYWEAGLEFVAQFFLIAFVANLFARPIIKLGHSLEAVEKGDLTNRIALTAHDEVGVLQKLFNSVLNKLNSILREVEDSGKHMGQSAYQVAKISHEIYDIGKQQESRSGEVTSAMQQLHNTSSAVQDQAMKAAERSRQVEALAREGIENVRQNINAMEDTTREVKRASSEIGELEESAHQIDMIVNTIKEIAGQTNLLALNAAIEAARAGEQGRGFAVVADEVRKLAERTSSSAEEVNSIIQQLTAKVQQVIGTMSIAVEKVNITQDDARKTASTIEVMAANSVETAQGNQGISDASRQQLQQFGLLQQTMETLFATLRENGTKVEATAAIGEDLRRVSGRLSELMSNFQFSHEVLIGAAQHEQRTAPRVNNSLLVKMTQGDNKIDAISQDFSLTGVRMSLPRRLDATQPVELQLYLPHEDLRGYESQEPIRMKAEVTWQDGQDGRNRCMAGLKFVGMTDTDRNKIKQCFKFYNANAEF
jgi:methyl-accepting chemotaxis protein